MRVRVWCCPIRDQLLHLVSHSTALRPPSGSCQWAPCTQWGVDEAIATEAAAVAAADGWRPWPCDRRPAPAAQSATAPAVAAPAAGAAVAIAAGAEDPPAGQPDEASASAAAASAAAAPASTACPAAGSVCRLDLALGDGEVQETPSLRLLLLYSGEQQGGRAGGGAGVTRSVVWAAVCGRGG